RIPRLRRAAVSTRVSVSASSQRSSLPLWMQSPVNDPSTRIGVPTSGAVAPLRARQVISSALPSLRAIAVPDALVNACARWARTAMSSEDPAVRAFMLVSEASVAMLRRPENRWILQEGPNGAPPCEQRAATIPERAFREKAFCKGYERQFPCFPATGTMFARKQIAVPAQPRAWQGKEDSLRRAKAGPTAGAYGQTRCLLLSAQAATGVCTATGRACSGEPPPSRIRAATRSASISACNPEI